MPTMEIGIEILHPDAAGEIMLDVEFKYRSGTGDIYTIHGWDQGDPPEIEIEHIYWPYERRRHEDESGKNRYVKDQIDIPTSMLPLDVFEAIEAEIIEKYNPADDCPEPTP